MQNQIISGLIKTLFICVLSLPIAGITAEESSGDNQALEEMQAHWEALINEKDQGKRSRMIKEHRDMMRKLILSDDGMHGKGHHHMHREHVLDMHLMMLNMMEQ